MVPALDPRRLATLLRASIDRMGLDLTGAVVLTEAAAGVCAVTPVLAAASGAARVHAATGPSCRGSVKQAWADILELAAPFDAAARLELVTGGCRDLAAGADIVTSCGALRPIDAELLGGMKPTAVVSLMSGAREVRSGDVDLDACARRGIPVAGASVGHPAVEVLPFLGAMAVRLLTEAGVAVHGSRVLLLCDNAFAPFIERGLASLGAKVDRAPALPGPGGPAACDAVVVALRSRAGPALSTDDAGRIARTWPGAVVAQLCGEIDRAAFAAVGVQVWPPRASEPGPLGISPSVVGPEPVVRLQAAGLKVGEILWRERCAGRSAAESVAAAVASGFGTAPPAPATA
jgi:hypothetical protein